MWILKITFQLNLYYGKFYTYTKVELICTHNTAVASKASSYFLPIFLVFWLECSNVNPRQHP